MKIQLATFLPVASFFLHICSAAKLGKYLRHYDTLNYDTTTLHRKHERSRRSLSDKVDLNFQAHGRFFQLELEPSAPHFSQGFTLETRDGESQEVPDYLYVGKLADDPDSHIHGSIINGRFSGTIYTDGKEEYHVENARHHFDEHPEFHSIIYKSSDIDFDHDHGGGCGAKEDIMSRMEEIQRSALDDSEDNTQENINWSQEQHSKGENKYSHPNRVRSRRQASPSDKTSCNLFLQADHTYTAHFNDGNEETAVAEVIASLHDHVSHVSQIFKQERFGNWINLDFMIERIKVNTSEDKTAPNNPFADEYIGVEKFLELNSLQNHEVYCLAYIFADRDFNDGVLGLAWVGSSDIQTSGGICERYKKFAGQVSQSLNTGIVTIQNYGSTVPAKVSYITFAHELGHNYGSPHDYPSHCKPGESPGGRTQGNFIMYPSATSGDKPNNNVFSPCSKSNITEVLDVKATCFQESGRPVCGNRIVEEGEECDCGYQEECVDDPCCVPRPDNGTLTSSACKLKTIEGIKAECSPSLGPCCNLQCRFRQTSENYVCRPDLECSAATICQGIGAVCPDAEPKEDLKLCNENKAVCLNGTCSGSLCLKFNFTECFCDPPTEDDEVDQSCHLCCSEDGGETCRSSTIIEAMDNFTMQYGEVTMDKEDEPPILYQQPGSPCNEYLGYCDVFYKCRLVDADGPLSRLTKAIFNPDLYENVFAWIQEYWWATILIGLGIVIFMALFIKCFSVHTPSSNPNMKQARKVSYYSNTIRRRPRNQPSGDMRMT